MAATNFDWCLCIFCQTDLKGEPLQNPSTWKRGNSGDGYLSVSSNIQKFEGINSLPMSVDRTLIGETNEIGKLLKSNQACWHTRCKTKFSNIRLQRAEARLEKQYAEDSLGPSSSKITRRSCGRATDTNQEKCFFCDEVSGELHKASTFNMDKKVRKCALDLQDTILLAKLSAGDLVSQDAVYHTKCLVSLYNRARPTQSGEELADSRKQLHGIVLAELVCYIEEARTETERVKVFKLSELSKLYQSRIKQLDSSVSDTVNSTHLKNRILSNFPEMHAHRKGRDVLLAFEDDIGGALKEVSKVDYDSDALILKQAATIIRKDIFEHNCVFEGQFSSECQQESVPTQLLSFVNMVIRGASIKEQSKQATEQQAPLTIAQLIQFNAVQRRREQGGMYHMAEREPPLPVYLGLLLHGETRKKGTINKVYDLGLSINYNRALAISTELGNQVCARFHDENVVCPPKLRRGIFTTSAVDNIDHNPSSSLAQGSFHGTGISLFQHPSTEGEGVPLDDRTPVTDIGYGKSLSPLPEFYTVVPPVAIPKKDIIAPEAQSDHLKRQCNTIGEEINAEYRWLEHVYDELQSESSNDMKTSWAAFHCNIHRNDRPLDTSALLPLFPEEAKSSAMIRHSMDIVTKTVEYLNPGQVPVMTCDQPLYAVAKQVQWYFKDTHGENRLVVILGGLHIEMAALKAAGNWLEGSGWTSALVQANVATAGKADSFLKASHMSRTRHAHQVTACALFMLMRRAYEEYLKSQEAANNPQGFEEWRNRRLNETPLFKYWSITLDLELSILLFVRSLREGNFELYMDALTKLAPWFFALDHPNYARWVPVHIRDMVTLGENHPTVLEAFKNGKFVVHKTHRGFSAIPIDQAHEQNNKCVKGEGGAIGLTENPMQLLRWMISGPEETRLIKEFETSLEHLKRQQDEKPDYRHHEEVKSVQNSFRKQVQAMCDVIDKMGNPFMETSQDVLVLDSRDIVDQRVSDTIQNIEAKGQQQFDDFVTERLSQRKKPLSDPIKQNKFPLFATAPVKNVSKEKQQISSLKQNCALFSKLYISCQVRSGNLEEFFKHENQPCPPSLSSQGKLRHGTKSDLIACLVVDDSTETTPVVDALLLDGAAIVNMLKPGAARTFKDYWELVFQPYLKRSLRGVKRLDIVWDVYMENSLKASERSQRGKGVRRRVKPDTVMPANWQSFLRNDENKKELFKFLAELSVSIECEEGQEVLSTDGDQVLISSHRDDLGRISPSDHEEADTRLILHAADVVQQGMARVMIRTVDTDVVVLATAAYRKLGLQELWIGFGTGKSFRCIPIHDVCQRIGTPMAEALPAFHAITGCDQTSAFAGKGKKTAWETWKVFADVTPAFQALSNKPSEEALEAVMPLVEQFVIYVYDKASTSATVDEARRDLFTRKGRAIEAIPPTSAALLQHVKRASYQAGYCWGQAMVAVQDLPDPSAWGWQHGVVAQTWEPVWTLLPQASESCLELLKCSCNVEKGCRGRCKCVTAHVLCTELCKCGGNCDRL